MKGRLSENYTISSEIYGEGNKLVLRSWYCFKLWLLKNCYENKNPRYICFYAQSTKGDLKIPDEIIEDYDLVIF